jgi:predicted DNA binding CopG/RHH family protein
MEDKQYDFAADKNHWLKENRHISFEEVIAALEEGKLLEVVEHPNKTKYPNQNMYVLEINDYIYLVPFVQQSENSIFLKTIFRSRKATKYYRNRGLMNAKKHNLLEESDQKLDAEEKELLESFERGEWKSIPNVEEAKAFAREAAANYFRKDARINIRLSRSDLSRIKQMAAYEGLPYQTLIASLLHKYAAGHL